MALTIRTNNVPRDVIYGWDLTPAEREEFDYIDWAAVERMETSPEFFRYRGQLYDLGEFFAANEVRYHPELRYWDGYLSDSFFSGIAVRFPIENGERDYERVVVGLILA